MARGRFQQFLKVAEGSRLSKLEPMSDTEMASNAIKDVREMAEQDLIGSRKTPFYEMFTRFAQQKVTSSDQEDTIEVRKQNSHIFSYSFFFSESSYSE